MTKKRQASTRRNYSSVDMTKNHIKWKQCQSLFSDPYWRGDDEEGGYYDYANGQLAHSTKIPTPPFALPYAQAQYERVLVADGIKSLDEAKRAAFAHYKSSVAPAVRNPVVLISGVAFLLVLLWMFLYIKPFISVCIGMLLILVLLKFAYGLREYEFSKRTFAVGALLLAALLPAMAVMEPAMFANIIAMLEWVVNPLKYSKIGR